MKDFILNLYNNEHFVLYLSIALVILVVLFVVVLFLGRKDKKLQETKKLEKLNVEDTFKEEKTENKIEVKVPENTLESEETMIPNMEGVLEDNSTNMNNLNENKVEESFIKPENNEPFFEEEPTIVVPVVNEETKLETSETPIEENNANMIEIEPQNVTNLESTATNISDDSSKLNNEEEIQNLNFDEINNSLEKELNELESLKKQFDDIELPESNLKDVSAEEDKTAEVKEESEKPVESEEPKQFQPSPQVFSSVFVDKNEDEFELPTLKKTDDEVKEDNKEEPEFSTSVLRFDEINGETYNLNNK